MSSDKRPFCSLKVLGIYASLLGMQIRYAVKSVLIGKELSKGLNPLDFIVYSNAVGILVLTPFALFLEKTKQPAAVSLPLFGQFFLLSLGSLEVLGIYASLLGMQISYAVNGVLIGKELSKGLNPLAFIVYSNAVGVLVLTPFSLFLEKTKRLATVSLPLFGQFFLLSLGRVSSAVTMSMRAVMSKREDEIIFKGEETLDKALELLETYEIPKGLLMPLENVEDGGGVEATEDIWLKQKSGEKHHFKRIDIFVQNGTEISFQLKNKMNNAKGVKAKK